MQTSVTPFLMFQGLADEAIRFYVSVLPNSRVLSCEHFGANGPGKAGTVAMARISLCGLEVMCNDSPVQHAFTFTPSSSLFVQCQSEAELDTIIAALAEGGQFLMAPGNYGFSRKFAWLNDRFGVSWQINLV